MATEEKIWAVGPCEECGRPILKPESEAVRLPHLPMKGLTHPWCENEAQKVAEREAHRRK